MTDLQIIKQIEEELNIKLEEVDEIILHTKGYTINNNGFVTGFGLNRFKTKELNRIIESLKYFKYLTDLYIVKIQI